MPAKEFICLKPGGDLKTRASFNEIPHISSVYSSGSFLFPDQNPQNSKSTGKFNGARNVQPEMSFLQRKLMRFQTEIRDFSHS
jgi:hypothetical protein